MAAVTRLCSAIKLSRSSLIGITIDRSMSDLHIRKSVRRLFFRKDPDAFFLAKEIDEAPQDTDRELDGKPQKPQRNGNRLANAERSEEKRAGLFAHNHAVDAH